MTTIRIAEKEDTESIWRLYQPYVDNTVISFEYEMPSKEAFEKRIVTTLEQYPYLVCVEGTTILGYAYAGRVRGREAYDWAAELSVYVHRDYHGKGIGSNLYCKLMNLLQRQGIRTVYGCVTCPNVKSDQLHHALGFHEAGKWHHCGFKQGKWLDVIWYEKIIGSSERPEPFIPFPDLDHAFVQKILSE